MVKKTNKVALFSFNLHSQTSVSSQRFVFSDLKPLSQKHVLCTEHPPKKHTHTQNTPSYPEPIIYMTKLKQEEGLLVSPSLTAPAARRPWAFTSSHNYSLGKWS